MKKLLSLALAAVMLLALLTACGGGNNGPANSGEPNTNTDQTEFNIISGISALFEISMAMTTIRSSTP